MLDKIDRVTDEQRAALAAELPDALVPRVIMNFPAGPFATIRMDLRRRQRRDGGTRPAAPAADAAR